MTMTLSGPVRRLVYTSKAMPGLAEDDLAAILETSDLHNTAAGITGALVFHMGCFVQVIEGAPLSIEALMESITNDRRHRDIVIQCDVAADRKHFDRWVMSFVGMTQRNSSSAILVRDANATRCLVEGENIESLAGQLDDLFLATYRASPAAIS